MIENPPLQVLRFEELRATLPCQCDGRNAGCGVRNLKFKMHLQGFAVVNAVKITSP